GLRGRQRGRPGLHREAPPGLDRPLDESSGEAGGDEGVDFLGDAGDEVGDGRDVVDQALDLADAPDARLGVAFLVDLAAAGAGDEVADVVEGAAAAFDLGPFGGGRVGGG